MTTKKKVFVGIGVFAVLLVAAGGGIWWMFQQPMYEPGALAQMNVDDPPSGADGWEVEPGVELAHFAVGEGANVLVVHGGPGIPQTESAPSLDALADGYRFHYYAQRGTGDSYRPYLDFSGGQWQSIRSLEGALGIAQQLADIERIRRLLGDERLILLGHSYGAFLAALYAAELPDKVKGLVLVAPANLVVFPPTHPGLFDTMRDSIPKAEHASYDAWLASYFDLMSAFSQSEAELAALDNQMLRFFKMAGGVTPQGLAPPAGQIGVWHARAQYFSMGLRHDYSDALGNVTAPTLVVHGGNDFQSVKVAEDYARWIADSRVVTVEGSGHFPHYTRPATLAPILRTFLDGL